MRSQPAERSRPMASATPGVAVAHRQLDGCDVRRQALLFQPLSEIAHHQRLLLLAVREQRRAPAAPDHRVFLRRARRPHAKHHQVQDRLPEEARDLDDATVRQKFREIATHGLCRRCIRRAEVQQQHAHPARPVMLPFGLGEKGAHWIAPARAETQFRAASFCTWPSRNTRVSAAIHARGHALRAWASPRSRGRPWDGPAALIQDSGLASRRAPSRPARARCAARAGASRRERPSRPSPAAASARGRRNRRGGRSGHPGT